jgi:hypothetical protein
MYVVTKPITDRVIAVDFGMSLRDMIAAGKYDWINPDIAAKHFPFEGTGKKAFRTKLFHFDRYISSDEVADAMKIENFTPATHIHGIAFGATFPEEQCKYPIACIGSSAEVHGTLSVVYLCRRGGRDLDLDGCGGVWFAIWRFLGVQEVSDV